MPCRSPEFTDADVTELAGLRIGHPADGTHRAVVDLDLASLDRATCSDRAGDLHETSDNADDYFGKGVSAHVFDANSHDGRFTLRFATRSAA